jgi:hypothetical protein
MREWLLAKVRDWYILGIGLILVCSGLIAASWYSPEVGPSNIAPSANGQPGPQTTSETTVSRPSNSQIALQATSGATQPAASPSTNSQPVPQTSSTAQPAASPPGQQPATPPPHDHATATRPAGVAQNVGQAPAANATASPAAPGEAEVGRQVRKSAGAQCLWHNNQVHYFNSIQFANDCVSARLIQFGRGVGRAYFSVSCDRQAISIKLTSTPQSFDLSQSQTRI